ncbi:MAG: fibronectin type III domain-containing protein [Bacteroidales bacterium]
MSVMNRIIITFISVFFCIGVVNAKRIYVKPGGTGDGSSWDKAAGDLNQIVDATERYSDDQIWVAEGTYQITGQLRLRASVDMYGGFSGTEIELSERDMSRKSTIVGGDFGTLVADGDVSYQTVIDGFIFKGANCPVLPTNVYGNIYLFQNSLIKNCIITGNLFQKNSAVGMEKSVMENCVIYDNTTTDWNAAIDLVNGSKISNCVVVNNKGKANGGLRARTNSVVANTFIWGNYGTATQIPCEAYIDDQTVRLVNCGYTNNFKNSVPQLINCIELTPENTNSHGPNFTDPVTGFFTLLPNSPAIDAGANEYASLFSDLIGNKRIAGARVDIGAYEFGSEKAQEDYTGTDKNIVINFEAMAINDGESRDVFGEIRTKAGTYFKDKGDHYNAARLTIVPLQTYERWTPYLQVPTSNSIIITWKAPVNTDTKVNYGTSPELLNQTESGTAELLADATATINYHQVKLTGLAADTKYYYQISGDEMVYSFRTQPNPGAKRNYRVLVLGDHQIINRSGYEWLIQAAKQTVEDKYGKWEENIDIVINTGDQVDKGTYSYYERCHFFKSSPIAPYLPIMTTLGNHESYEDPNLEKYGKLFQYENLAYKGISSGTDNYYAFQEGRIVFIMLSTESIHTNDAQLSWLKKVLETASADTEVDFVMSTCHRPMCSETYITDYSGWLKNTVVPVLGSCPKHVLNIAAHHHYYQRGQVANYPFYHIISGGASWDQTWEIAPNKLDDGLVQKTMDYWTYQIINFSPETKRMDVETYSIGNKNVVHHNNLIDSFSRDLLRQEKPLTPELGPVDEFLTFPTTIISSSYRSDDISDFNTCHFQIATSADFRTPAIDQYNHVENLFEDGGAPWYIPVNTAKDQDCFKLDLSENALPSGKYYVRVRHRNNNVQWSDWSTIKTFLVVGEEDKSPVLILEKELWNVAEPVKIGFENAPVGTKAWIGIYLQGAPTTGVTPSKKWAYTNTDSGTISVTGLSSGKYFAVLYGDSGYNTITKLYNFEVTDEEIALLKSDKQLYDVGESIDISFTRTPGYASDWIGIYRQSDDQVPGDKGYTSVVYSYIPEGTKSGNSSFQNATKLIEGHYFVGLFLKGAYNEAAQRIHLIIGNAPQLTSLKSVYQNSENVALFLSDKPKFSGCELVVRNILNASVVERIRLNPEESSVAIFRQYPKGNYSAELQMDGIDKSVSNILPFAVEDGLSLPNISASCRVYPNPVVDKLYIDCVELIRAELYTNNGIRIETSVLNSGVLDMSELPSGSYHLVIFTSNGKQSVLVVKK